MTRVAEGKKERERASERTREGGSECIPAVAAPARSRERHRGPAGKIFIFFLHVDSSHSALISANSGGLAGAGSVQEGVIMRGEEDPAPPNGILNSDWSGAGEVRLRCGGSYRAGSDCSSWLAASAANYELALRTGHLFRISHTHAMLHCYHCARLLLLFLQLIASSFSVVNGPQLKCTSAYIYTFKNYHTLQYLSWLADACACHFANADGSISPRQVQFSGCVNNKAADSRHWSLLLRYKVAFSHTAVHSSGKQKEPRDMLATC